MCREGDRGACRRPCRGSRSAAYRGMPWALPWHAVDAATKNTHNVGELTQSPLFTLGGECLIGPTWEFPFSLQPPFG